VQIQLTAASPLQMGRVAKAWTPEASEIAENTRPMAELLPSMSLRVTQVVFQSVRKAAERGVSLWGPTFLKAQVVG
jgi:hypothetical protein